MAVTSIKSDEALFINKIFVDADIRRRLILTYFDIFKDLNPIKNFSHFSVAAFQWVVSHLNSDTLVQISEIVNDPKSPGYLVFDGLPIDKELPNTPHDGLASANKKTFVSEALLLGISSLFGKIYSYQNEKKGNFIHDICPQKDKVMDFSNAGSKANLLFHTEVASFESRPDYLALICLKNNLSSEAKTGIVEINQIISDLDPETLKRLLSPEFMIKTPASFYSRSWSGPVSILSGPADNPQIRVNFNFTNPLNQKAEMALKKLHQAILKNKIELKLLPGQMVLIDNRKSLHARSSFKASFDGNDRWLQRVYIRKELWSIRHRIESEKLLF